VALALTLTSVRRRRRDLALLKTLGFTRRQLVATVSSQATVPALTIILVALGALILANLVAAIAGLQAARTRTALLLHAE
jgi:ABC-type antimicrobial peptide transport system permease subunit